MIDEIRILYREQFGQKAYERAVSGEERNKTAERVKVNGLKGMFIANAAK